MNTWTRLIGSSMKNVSLAGVLLLAASAAPAFAQELAGAAVNSVGHWRVTFFLEPNHSTGATQCISFTKTGTILGEPRSGRWTSPTFAGWTGQWIQEGDHFRFYGVTSSLGTAEFGAMINSNSFSGEFAHFSKTNGATSSAGSFQATRVSTCGTSLAAPAGGSTDPGRPDGGLTTMAPDAQ